MKTIIDKNFVKYLVIVLLGVVIISFLISTLTKKSLAFIEGNILLIEKRTTDEERRLGLSGRESLCEKCGMLFLFPGEKERGFWMKDMRFDIDIIWLRSGEVIHIEEEVSHETPEKIYKPQIQADTVLELPAGKVREYDIKLHTTLLYL